MVKRIKKSMRLIANCKHCREEIRLRKSVNDRGELAREEGDQLMLECGKCSRKETYHVNEVRAQESKTVAISALLVFVFGTAIIGYELKAYFFLPNNPYSAISIGGALLIPVVVYGLLMKQERDKVSLFNSYRA